MPQNNNPRRKIPRLTKEQIQMLREKRGAAANITSEDMESGNASVKDMFKERNENNPAITEEIFKIIEEIDRQKREDTSSASEKVPFLRTTVITPTEEMKLGETVRVSINVNDSDDPKQQVLLDVFCIKLNYNPEILALKSYSMEKWFISINKANSPHLRVTNTADNQLEIEIKSDGAPFSIVDSAVQLQFEVRKTPNYPTALEADLVQIGRNINGKLVKTGSYFVRGLVKLQSGAASNSTPEKVPFLRTTVITPKYEMKLGETVSALITVTSDDDTKQAVLLDLFCIKLNYSPDILALKSFSLDNDFAKRNEAHPPYLRVKNTAADQLEIELKSDGSPFSISVSAIILQFEVRKTANSSTELKPDLVQIGRNINGKLVKTGSYFTRGLVKLQPDAASVNVSGAGPSGNNVSMESVGAIAQSYLADRIAPTASITGRGYNLLTAHVWSAKDMPVGAIIDFTGLHGAISQTLVGSQDFTVVTESSTSKLSKKFSEKTNLSCGFGMFKMSFSQSYSQNSNVSEDKAYSKIWYEYIGMREDITTSEWKKHLNPFFWRDLNDSAVSPATLFERYGTHLILRGLYGGHMDLLGTTYKKVADTTTKIEASLSASVGAKAATAAKANGMSIEDILAACAKLGITPNVNVNAGGGQPSGSQQQNNNSGGGKEGEKNLFSLGFETSYEESTSHAADKLNLEGHMVGGLGNIPKTLEEFTGIANSWIGSLKDQSTWRFCGVPKGSDSLYPIWQLAATDARRKQLSDYFDAELLKNQSALIEQESYVTGIMLVWAKSENDAKTKAAKYEMQGYKFITDHDLNDGMKGAGYLFIGYLRETKEQMRRNGHRPITNLFIYCDDKQHKSWQYDRFDSWKRDHGNEVQLDGCYLNSNFDYFGYRWYSEDNYNEDKLISDLNHGKVTAGRFLLLCFTTDTRFTPLTALGVYYDEDEYDAYHESKEWIDVPERGRCTMSGPRCNTTAGTDGTKTFIVFKRSAEKFTP